MALLPKYSILLYGPTVQGSMPRIIAYYSIAHNPVSACDFFHFWFSPKQQLSHSCSSSLPCLIVQCTSWKKLYSLDGDIDLCIIYPTVVPFKQTTTLKYLTTLSILVKNESDWCIFSQMVWSTYCLRIPFPLPSAAFHMISSSRAQSTQVTLFWLLYTDTNTKIKSVRKDSSPTHDKHSFL